MLRIKPFAAIRPHPSDAAHVACVPYDVVNTAEARELAKGLPNSFLHVVRSEIDLPQSTNPYDAAVYAKARETFKRLLDQNILLRESSPRMYLYRQVMDHRSQIGLVCCCHIDDYADDIIRKHENTRKDKEDDRTRHVLELNAHAEPVFLAYRDEPRIDELVKVDVNDRPLFHFVAKDRVTHTVWTVHDAQAYVEAFAREPGIATAYIADGHHRTASAARAGFQRRAGNPKHSGVEEYNWFPAVLFPSSQLRILPYNRLVRDLNGLQPSAVLKKLNTIGTLSHNANPHPQRPGTVYVYIDRAWHALDFDPRSIDTADPINSLDVSLLQDRVLGPVLGIGDPRTDKRIDFVGGIRGTEELERRVNSREMVIAFSLFPTTIEQLMAVADAGAIMPPKSTWFEPKLRSGLLVHSLD